MALTLKWWTDLKGKTDNMVNGKIAPETEFEKKLRVYDTARGSHHESPVAHTRASKALDEVQNARTASSKELVRLGFEKLAAQCNPNTRVLTTLIGEERKMLATAKLQVAAISKIGQPSLNLNAGPGGNNIRQGKFKEMQGKIKTLNDTLRNTPQLKREDIDKCLTHMEGIAKDVKLYFGDRAVLKPFHDDYVGTVAGFKTVKAKWGDKKTVTKEMLTIGTRLTRMVSAQYVA